MRSEPDDDLRLVIAIEGLKKSMEDWVREVRRMRRRMRELGQDYLEDLEE